MECIKLKMEGRGGFEEITDQIRDYIARHRIKEGMVIITTPDIASAVTLANKDNDKMATDFLTRLEKMIPQFDGMKFSGWEIPGLKAAIVGQTLQIMVSGGCPILGVHQGIFAVDFTGYAADFSDLDERYFFLTHFGTELAEGEEAVMPEELKTLSDAIIEEERRKKEEEERIVEEMRQEAIERQRIAEEERKAGKRKKYETPAWMRKQIDEGKF